MFAPNSELAQSPAHSNGFDGTVNYSLPTPPLSREHTTHRPIPASKITTAPETHSGKAYRQELAAEFVNARQR
ncbi:hypothetical protein WKK05_13205 [Nostoc sp. UHCC 0302]|uniref:hypothetical protein n=1 Tax=Nostoc sp. UHCC 0302 TaxID=3134896 RepID=UPI00311C9B47